MAKRFTDSSKWTKPFMRKMPTAYKLLWIYMLDECDHAGIWQVDFVVAEIKIGEEINENDAREFFGEKIIEFDGCEKWFIPDFIKFQYGELRDNNKAHISVLKTLERYNLTQFVSQGFTTPLNNNIKGQKKADLFIRNKNTCVYCEQIFQPEELEPDHLIPLKKGGRNDLENIVCSCKTCNRKKSDLDLDEFISKFSLDKEKIYRNILYSRGLVAPWGKSQGAKDKDKDKEMDKDKDMEKVQEVEKSTLHEIPRTEFVSTTTSEPILKKTGIYISPDLIRTELSSRSIWRDQVCMNLKTTHEVLNFHIDEFTKTLELNDHFKTYHVIDDAIKHFVNYLKLQLKNATATKIQYNNSANSRENKRASIEQLDDLAERILLGTASPNHRGCD